MSLWTDFLSADYDLRVLCHGVDAAVLEILGSKIPGLTAPAIKNDGRLGRAGRLTVIAGAAAVYNEIKSFGPDAVISMFVWADFLVSAAMRLRLVSGAPSIAHIVYVAGNPMPPVKFFLKKKLYATLSKSAFKCASGVICICRHDARLLCDEYRVDERKIEVVPIGIRVRPFEARKTHDPFTFGIVSRLSPEKRIDAVLRLIKEVALERGENFRLLVFGDGNDGERLRALARDLRLGNVVRFQGWVKDPDIAFTAIDCMLMFSTTEGTPRSILEAAERGVPSIAKDVGGVGEVIIDGKTGFLINGADQLKEKIIHMMSAAGEAQRLGLAARRRIEESRNVDGEITKLKSIIEGLTGD
ncbi:MAG: glycosyltransferase [Nitrospiraceae bacterium]|nr:glycosyltransferase [Nitrospiraceae bacterium]